MTYRHALLGLAGALLASAAAHAATATLVPIIPFPDSTNTVVFGITDDNSMVAGSYIGNVDGITHGFVGTIDGNYTSFDFDNSGSGTQARAIANDGTTTGFANSTSTDHCTFIEWQRQPNGDPVQILKGSTPVAGIAQGIDSSGRFAADFCKPSGTIVGFVGRNGKLKDPVDTGIPSAYTGPRGLNKDGTVVGFYVNPDTGLQIGTITKNGVTSQFSYPDGTQAYTVFEGINNDGTTTGQWGDTDAVTHSFILDADGSTATPIEVPGSTTFTQAWGINKKGMVAVSANTDDGIVSFIYCPHKPSKCPSTGNAVKVIQTHPIHVSAAKMLAYGDFTKHGAAKPLQSRLPKGASAQ